MTNPKFIDIQCEHCGAVLGRKAGEKPVFGLICDDPLCAWTGVPWPDEPRDAYLVALAQDGVKVTTVAKALGLSRQRVYQIFDKWKGGS